MPAVVSRIIGNTKPRIFLLEAATVVYSFTASAFQSDWPSVRDDPAGLVRLAIPASAVLLVLLVRNGYSAESRSQLAPLLDVAAAFAFAVLSQIALAAVAPELTLPRWAPTQGTFVGWMFLTGLRSFFPPRPRTLAGRPLRGPLFLEEIQYKAREFERTIWRRNRIANIVLAVLSIASIANFLASSSLRVRAACMAILSGALYVLVEIRRNGLPARAWANSGLVEYGNAYRTELQRQSALLQRVWYRYFASLLPGCFLLLQGSFVYPYILPLCILLFAEIHLREAEKLQHELDEFC
jgi:hypothetical protein